MIAITKIQKSENIAPKKIRSNLRELEGLGGGIGVSAFGFADEVGLSGSVKRSASFVERLIDWNASRDKTDLPPQISHSEGQTLLTISWLQSLHLYVVMLPLQVFTECKLYF
jgi:hypothetical protein